MTHVRSADQRFVIRVAAVILASMFSLSVIAGDNSVLAARAEVAPGTEASCIVAETSPVGDGIDLEVPVVGTGPTTPECSPVDSGTTNGGSPAPSGSTRGTSAITAPTDAVAPVTTDPAPASDEFELGGILYIGGLKSGYSPSINPAAGEAQLWFSVRNVSKTPIDATADFTLTGPFGNTISRVNGVTVDGLKPGEQRIVSAILPAVGQWSFVQGRATLVPPATVEGVNLAKVTRDAHLFAPPWVILTILVLALGAFGVRHFLRSVGDPASPFGPPTPGGMPLPAVAGANGVATA